MLAPHLCSCHAAQPGQLCMKRAAFVAAMPLLVGTQAGGGPNVSAYTTKMWDGDSSQADQMEGVNSCGQHQAHSAYRHPSPGK
jgi:hypothetical protein